MNRRRRSRIRYHRNVIRLDGDGVHRHRVRAITGLQEKVEGLTAVVGLLDDVACETFADSDPAEQKSATTMMRAAVWA